MIVTNSELQSWQHCKRCWWLGYYRQLRKLQDVRSPLTVGSLYHRALQSYYTPDDPKHPLDYVRVRATALIEQHPEFAEDIATDAELVGIMVDGYMGWVEETGQDADLEVYAAEQMLEVALGETGHVLRGKLDARAFNRSDGTRRFLEHKTVQNLKDLLKTAQTNQQFLNYELLEYLDMLARGVEGDRADGTLLNMAKKVKRTARATPPFYAREPVRHNLQELRNHWTHVLATTDLIVQARARLDAGEDHHAVVPPTINRDCEWRCSFSSVCQSGIMDDGSDWEGYLALAFEVHNPLERYEEEEVNV